MSARSKALYSDLNPRKEFAVGRFQRIVARRAQGATGRARELGSKEGEKEGGRRDRNHGGQPLYPRARSEPVEHHEQAHCLWRGVCSTPLWEFGSSGPGCWLSWCCVTFPQASLFLRVHFFPGCAPRTPTVHLHTRATAIQAGRKRADRYGE
ncbi:uncharacterized protein LOC123988464 [Osmia bicornis bicornis]|uniref:uncharacterized protein LOC123988464 n=1 Tax=Osmia bicornis bicornis TaxID=1437191 RepID=UPI001EAE853C|nr:uncharacterized protein LOC123988464 [Osmia bicornis bicornis]